MRILRSRLSRYGAESTCCALSPAEMAMILGCSRRYMQVRLRQLESKGRLTRIAHGFYRAVSVV